MLLLWLSLLIQEVSSDIIDPLSRISPYNATAYGGLVLVLVLFVYLQHKDKEKQALTLEKAVDTLNDIEISLRAIPELRLLILSKLLNNHQPEKKD